MIVKHFFLRDIKRRMARSSRCISSYSIQKDMHYAMKLHRFLTRAKPPKF